MNTNKTTASLIKRTIAFAIDLLLGAALVVTLLIFQESFRSRQAFDKSKHYELADTGIPQWFRYALDSLYEKEFEPSLFIRGIIEEKSIAIPILFLTPWLIFGLLFAITGASPGKLLFGIRVRTSLGGRLSLGKFTIRYFGKWLSAIPAFGGFVLAFTNSNHKALHDRLTDTMVINS